MAESTMSTQFSKDGKYFAQITTDGKLKIWETATSTFKQEFTPNLHLTTPCTCLHWIQGKTQSQRKKKKRRHSETESTDDSTPLIALGTSSGALLLYSFASANVESTVNSQTSHGISCITWVQGQDVYVGAEQMVILFDLKSKTVKTKWKSGNDQIRSILHVPNKQRLLTASKTIKLWDTTTKETIKTFTGHSSDVSVLHYIPSLNADPYFVSGSQCDRLLNVWSLNEKSREKNAIASLLMEDIVYSISLIQLSDNTTNLTAVTRSGVVHVYQHTLNGKCAKPIKPKVTVQVASDTGQTLEIVTPISIIGAHLNEDTTVLIAHGNNVVLTFENIVPSSFEKVQILIRKDPRKILASKENDITKSKTAVTDNNVEYLTPYTSNNYKMKRKLVTGDQPMEQRLENLTLNRLDTSKVPKQDNVAQLLVQGLHSKDKAILHMVLSKRDESLIRNTVRRLPMQVIVPLATELSSIIQGKTLSSQTGVLWLRYLIQSHASQLLSNPNMMDIIAPVLGSIESRLSLLQPLARLRGRLDLIVSQITASASTDDTEQDEPLLQFKDTGSSDSETEENLELTLHSDSENEWVEDENSGNDSTADDENKIDENHVSDSDMSVA